MPESSNLTIRDRLRGADCTVLGYGVSNRPLVPWLLAHGAHSVTVRDRSALADMEARGQAETIRAAGATLRAGDHYLDGVEKLGAGDLIFRSPGIRPDLPPIRKAVENGACLTSEMELFLALTKATVIGISGSDGKTTTTTLTARILEAACARKGKGHVYLGGNIGTPLLPFVDDMTAADFAVVELSSFQLMTADRPADRAILTNITPNHLNWHRDMAEYVAAKTRLCIGAGDLNHLSDADRLPRFAVLNAGNPYTREIGEKLPVPVIWFSEDRMDFYARLPRRDERDRVICEQDGMISLCDIGGEPILPLLRTDRIRLPGRHNVENYMAAMGAALFAFDGEEAPAAPEDAGTVADTFLGVAHRLELVRTYNGVKFYNSSIDSSPTRTVAALNALRDLQKIHGDHDPIVICGGQDKHVPFDPLAEALVDRAQAVILTGEAREEIREALHRCRDFDPEKLPVTVIPDWTEAMETACRMGQSGDVVLLSPACTSFDAFRNFEERGEAFRAIVNGL